MPNPKVSKSLWKDVVDEDKLIDSAAEAEICRLFGIEPAAPKAAAADAKPKKVKEALPSFLDSKRANNVGLLMGRIKMSNSDLQAAIKSGAPAVVNEDTLRILQQVILIQSSSHPHLILTSSSPGLVTGHAA